MTQLVRSGSVALGILVGALCAGACSGSACSPLEERVSAPPSQAQAQTQTQPTPSPSDVSLGDVSDDMDPRGDAAPRVQSVPTIWPQEAVALFKADTGVFSHLTGRVRLRHPSWLSAGPHAVAQVVGEDNAPGFVLVDGQAVAFAVGGEGALVEATKLDDADADGIPNQLDILIGAKKTTLNGAKYLSTYRLLDYPGGDVPSDEGVCTDVIIRALRNAGFDLQQLLAEDIEAHPGRYPMVTAPDPSIDQRRVRTLLPYFQAHWRKVPSQSPLLPGDVCFMDTMGGSEPEHMGIVSDRTGASKKPLIINNWNDGTKTAEMDLLDFVPITHRFRPPRDLNIATDDSGLSGLLRRRGIDVRGQHRQLIMVLVPAWDSSVGELRRYERQQTGRYSQVGETIVVTVGQRGLGRGRGLHGPSALEGLAPKEEGDQKAPAGMFTLGTAFGAASRPPYHPGNWPWRVVGPRDRFVDDPKSPLYNSWQVAPSAGQAAWSSAERLSIYELGVVVEHNRSPTKPGAGSAIFLHTWRGPQRPTIGCSAARERHLVELLRWLDPQAQPVLVQVAGTVF